MPSYPICPCVKVTLNITTVRKGGIPLVHHARNFFFFFLTLREGRPIEFKFKVMIIKNSGWDISNQYISSKEQPIPRCWQNMTVEIWAHIQVFVHHGAGVLMDKRQLISELWIITRAELWWLTKLQTSQWTSLEMLYFIVFTFTLTVESGCH